MAELDVEVVLHRAGPGGCWGARVYPGHRIQVLARPGGHAIRGELAHYVLVGDESAVPAIATILERLEPSQRATVVVEVEDGADERRLHSSAGLDVAWFHRRGGPQGRLAVAALREVGIAPGATFVWAAGEAALARGADAHVRAIGLPAGDYDVETYWHARSAARR